MYFFYIELKFFGMQIEHYAAADKMHAKETPIYSLLQYLTLFFWLIEFL